MLSINYLKSKMITLGFTLFWMVFWLFNGLDKFLNRTEFGAVTWFGKDRGWQFGVYLENMGISLDYVSGILTFAGIWEIALSIIFIAALNIMIVAGRHEQERSDSVFIFGLFVSMLTFIAFCAFDTIVGDRAELLEHSTYMIVIAVSYISLMVENVYVQQSLKNTAIRMHNSGRLSLDRQMEVDINKLNDRGTPATPAE